MIHRRRYRLRRPEEICRQEVVTPQTKTAVARSLQSFDVSVYKSPCIVFRENYWRSTACGPSSALLARDKEEVISVSSVPALMRHNLLVTTFLLFLATALFMAYFWVAASFIVAFLAGAVSDAVVVLSSPAIKYFERSFALPPMPAPHRPRCEKMRTNPLAKCSLLPAAQRCSCRAPHKRVCPFLH